MSEKKVDIPWWASIILSVIIIVGALSIGLLFERLDTTDILFAIFLVVLSAIIGAVVARFTAFQQLAESEKSLERKFDTLEKQISIFQEENQKIIGYAKTYQESIISLDFVSRTMQQVIQGKLGEFLITYDNLVEIESSVPEEEEIWILTSALELEDDELKDVIRNNFGKKIKYRYIIPDNRDLKNRMIFLAQQWKSDCNLSIENAKTLIECYLLPEHLVYMTVIIYKPNSPKPNIQPTVLVKFSTSKFYKKEDYPFILQVNPKQVGAWNFYVEALKNMMNSSKQLSIDFSKELKNGE